MCHLPVAPPYIVFPGPFPPDLGGGTRSPRFPLRSCLVASVFLPVIFFDIDWLGTDRCTSRGGLGHGAHRRQCESKRSTTPTRPRGRPRGRPTTHVLLKAPPGPRARLQKAAGAEVEVQQDGAVSPNTRLMTLRTRMLRMLSAAKGVQESGSNQGGLPRTFVVCVAAVVTCAFAWHAPKAFGESFADHATRLSRSSDPFFQHVAASRLAFVAKHAPHALHSDEERTHAIVALMDPERRRDVRLEAMRAMHILLETPGGDQAMERHRNDIEHALERNNEDDMSSPETVEAVETLRRSMKRATSAGT